MLWRKKVGGVSSGVLTKAALDYSRLGWSSFPVESGGKDPLVQWEVYQQRRAKPPEIGDWFTRWPDANLAVVTGVVSGLVVLDIDPRQGGEDSLERLQKAHGPLAETVEAVTGTGGRHLYFAHPGEITPNRAGIAPGIDLWGDGGYVVAPPSVHQSGKPYRWIRSPEVTPLEFLPRSLFGTTTENATGPGQRSARWRRLLRQGAEDGERNDTLISLAGYLLRPGVDSDVVVELLISWNAVRCRPPLEPADIVRMVESVARIKASGDR